jgi:hypothetical protein
LENFAREAIWKTVKSNRGLMDERKLEQSRLRAWLAGRLGRKDIPDPVWEILEYRGHVQEALREDIYRGTLVVYARALLPYAEVMESVAALPERSARKQRAHYPDPPQHSEYELERPRILGEYVAVRAELDTRVQHLRERSLEQGRLLSPAEAEEYLQWRRNKYPPEARRSTFPSPEVLELLSEWLVEEFEGYWDRERALWFLLTDEAPSAEPIFSDIRPLRVGKHLSYGRLILQVEPWVPAQTVTAYYRLLQVSILGHIPRALSLRNLKLARFVLNHLRHMVTAEVRGKGVSGMPSWRALMMRWNKAHPKMAYDNERLFHRDFFRTARSVVRPYGSKQGPDSDEGAREPWESDQETLFAESEGQTDAAGVYYHPAPRPPTPETL